ncbi:alcohol dehydrogenase catalytic domain-containing protein [Actinoallomurus acanthiterrae]
MDPLTATAALLAFDFQSDLHVIDAAPGVMPFASGFTLGHEAAGRVAAVGAAVTGIAVGDAVVVYGPWGCGRCRRCSAGRENYCDRRATLTWAGMGLGRDGGMADYVLVPSARHLETIGDLDPAQAAPLSDAGLTPYHAIQRRRPWARDRRSRSSGWAASGISPSNFSGP